MDSQNIYVLLDTMVYLHYRTVEHLNLLTTLGVNNCTILIPRITMQELDIHKNTHQNPKIRERARKRLLTIRQWIDKGEACPGLKVEFGSYRPNIDFKVYGLDGQWNDDQLIATIIHLKMENPDRRVVLLTQDTGMLLTAKHLGIESVTVADAYRLPDEADPIAKENQDLKNELLRMKTAQPVLLVRLKGMTDDIDHATFELAEPSRGTPFNKDAFLAKLRDGMPEIYPTPSAGKVTSPLAVQRALAIAFEDRIPKSEYDRYNREREVYFREMSDFVDRRAAYRTQVDRMLLLELEMRNTGFVPAEDVDIALHFPDGFELYPQDDLPRQPQEPDPPAPPQTDLHKLMAGIGINTNFDRTAYFPRLSALGPADPFSLKKTNSYDLTDHVSRLKHGCNHEIRRLCLVFPSYEVAKSFSIEYRLAAANLPTPASGELHIVVKKK